MLGCSLFGYIKFFTADPDAVQIINQHVRMVVLQREQCPCPIAHAATNLVCMSQHRAMTSIMFSADASLWRDHFGSGGGLKKRLLEDRTCPTVLDEEVRRNGRAVE